MLTNEKIPILEAYNYCQKITKDHYENFPVASVMIPTTLRKHVYAIYAFARHADDLSDEKHDMDGLIRWRQMLHESLAEEAKHPIFVALSDTINKFNLPVELFDKLITAFQQDLEKNRFQNFDELFDYCDNSANPVGRIILRLNGYSDDVLFQYSDYICTALQLTNFWQDVKIDIKKNRIYIPEKLRVEYNVNESQIEKGDFSDNFRNLMVELVSKTSALFDKGIPLLQMVSGRLKWELKFTINGGLAILSKIRHIDYNVLRIQPLLNKLDWTKITLNLVINRNGNLWKTAPIISK